MTDEYKPMVYYNSSNAHSGSYALLINKRCIYAMPAYEGDVSSLQLQFYLKQTQYKYQLQVGVMSDLNDHTTFVPVATFNNTSTTDSVLRTVDFASYTGDGHYIAFRNILAATWPSLRTRPLSTSAGWPQASTPSVSPCPNASKSAAW